MDLFPLSSPSASALAGSPVCYLSWQEPVQHLGSLGKGCDLSATHIPSLTSPPVRNQVCLSLVPPPTPQLRKHPACLLSPPLSSWDLSCTLGSPCKYSLRNSLTSH